MYTSLAVLGLAAVAKAMPQGVTQNLPAPGAPAAGCNPTASGTFQIQPLNASNMAHMKEKRQSNDDGSLILNLNNGVLKNQQGDTGYVANNFQFQFDNPPQTGAIYTSGFSICGNGTLAHGASALFYSCNSGGFNNLYDRNWAPQCSPVYLNTTIGGSGSSSSNSGSGSGSSPSGASQAPDNQPQAGTTAASAVSRISDQQPQAPTNAPTAAVTQISDMQPQAPTSAPTAAVTQISDHQPQAGTSAPTAAVSQISDHQPQAGTSAPAVSQISDHQPQVPTSAPSVAVSQISDHQPQVPTSVGTPVAASTPAQYTGGAPAPTAMANMALAGAAVVGAILL